MTAPLSAVESVEALTVLIERSATDITADYGDWCSIGFALAHEFGAAGEPYFHRISAFYPNYDPSEASKQYAYCLRHKVPSGKAPVTIATLFHLAKSHGINLPAPRMDVGREPMCSPCRRPGESVPLPEGVPLRGGGVTSLSSGGEGRGEEVSGHTPRKSRGEASPPLRGGGRRPGESSKTPLEEFEEFEEIASEAPLPTFSQSIRNDLPTIMQRIVADSTSDVDADILVLGSLTVFSACIPNVFGVYDRRQVFANLFLFVTARASAGKGRLSLCRHLAMPLHQALRDKYQKLMKEYEAAQVAYAVNRKNTLEVPPQEPPFLTLFVPANSTATVVYQTLSQNDGVGLLFETEGDTLANAFNSDLGNYSDGFRKAFHHESISYLRKKDHEFVEIVQPKFSAVLSGTPQQIFNLIPDAENGLFSRFVFYVMPTQLVWHDMFACSGTIADEQFKQIGRDFYDFHKAFSKKRVQFAFSRAQQHQFNTFFEATQLCYAQLFGDDIIASVRRLGLILFRFAMILSVLRLIDDPPKPAKKGEKELHLVCIDADFATALAMVKVLLQHTASVFQTLPRSPQSVRAPKGMKQLAEGSRSKFLAALPVAFTRADFCEVALSLGITTKTAERYITELCKNGQLEHPAHGQYYKPDKNR